MSMHCAFVVDSVEEEGSGLIHWSSRHAANGALLYTETKPDPQGEKYTLRSVKRFQHVSGQSTSSAGGQCRYARAKERSASKSLHYGPDVNFVLLVVAFTQLSDLPLLPLFQP